MTQPNNIDPIEEYLDALAREFGARNSHELRNLLFEIDAHLRESVDRHIASGLDEITAKRQAVRDLGPASDLARNDQQHLRSSVSALMLQFIVTGILLGCIAAVVVGASGVISEVANLSWGKSAVIDVAPGHTLSAQDCERWMANDPNASTCHQAALDDWIGEVVMYRVAAGIIGVSGLATLWLLRREVRYLPAIVVHTIGTLGFGATLMWTFGLGFNSVFSASGAGIWQWFSATIAASFALAYFGVRMVQDLRSPEMSNRAAAA